MEQIPEFRMLWNAKNNTEYVFLSIFYPIFAFPDRNFSCENEIEGKNVIQGVFVKIECIWTFLAMGNLHFSSRLSYQSKDKVTQLAKDGNKWRKTCLSLYESA